ncbi:MAG: hypothetical protein WBA74_17480 [Cyclobacteriaceae bacterium]
MGGFSSDKLNPDKIRSATDTQTGISRFATAAEIAAAEPPANLMIDLIAAKNLMAGGSSASSVGGISILQKRTTIDQVNFNGFPTTLTLPGTITVPAGTINLGDCLKVTIAGQMYDSSASRKLILNIGTYAVELNDIANNYIGSFLVELHLFHSTIDDKRGYSIFYRQGDTPVYSARDASNENQWIFNPFDISLQCSTTDSGKNVLMDRFLFSVAHIQTSSQGGAEAN